MAGRAVPLFSGLLETWAEESFEWLSANITAGHVAELALWVADQLPAEQEAAILDAVVEDLAATSSPHAGDAGTGRASADDDLASGGNHTDSEPRLTALAVQVADHLGRCRADAADRLARLVALSDAAPRSALPRILGAVDRTLDAQPRPGTLDGERSAVLRRELTGMLARALTSDADFPDNDIDYDTAAAAEALGRAAPAETAQVLVDRTLGAAVPLIPFLWADLLANGQPGAREPLATGYQEMVVPRLGELPAEAEAAALDVLAVLGCSLPRWTALVRDWATGGAADRARAAHSIRHCWPDPIWRELVPELLDAGLTEQGAAALRQGLLPINDVADAKGLSDRLDALQPLLDDTRPVVNQFATEAAQGLHALMSPLKEWNEGAEQP
jgi:hypothetical protein